MVLEMAKSLSSSLSKVVKFHIEKNKNQVPVKRRNIIKNVMFYITSIFIVIVACFTQYVQYYARQLFSSMIASKGLTFPNMGFKDTMIGVQNALSSVGGDLIGPVTEIFSHLQGFSINYDTIGITCKGATAPIELTINLVILGLIVIIIVSDFHCYEMT